MTTDLGAPFTHTWSAKTIVEQEQVIKTEGYWESKWDEWFNIVRRVNSAQKKKKIEGENEQCSWRVRHCETEESLVFYSCRPAFQLLSVALPLPVSLPASAVSSRQCLFAMSVNLPYLSNLSTSHHVILPTHSAIVSILIALSRLASRTASLDWSLAIEMANLRLCWYQDKTDHRWAPSCACTQTRTTLSIINQKFHSGNWGPVWPPWHLFFFRLNFVFDSPRACLPLHFFGVPTEYPSTGCALTPRLCQREHYILEYIFRMISKWFFPALPLSTYAPAWCLKSVYQLLVEVQKLRGGERLFPLLVPRSKIPLTVHF